MYSPSVKRLSAPAKETFNFDMKKLFLSPIINLLSAKKQRVSLVHT